MIDIREHGGIFGGEKYRKGSFIPFSKIAPFQPLRFIMYYPGTSYNQAIHRKYANDKTGNVFIPVHEGTEAHRIFVYNKNGEKISTISWEHNIYGTIVGMIERNGYLFVFSDGACIKFDVSTGTKIQADTTSDWRIASSSNIIQKENIVYIQTRTHSIVKLDLDTFAVISKYTVNNPYNNICLKDIDENENAYLLGSGGYLLKYSNSGTLIFNNKLKHTASHYYKSALYSKTKNSILLSTYDTSLKKGYIEEWGLDGSFKKEVDITQHFQSSPSTVSEIFKTNDMLIVCSDAGALLLNESDLSFIKRIEGVFYTSDHTMHVSDRYIVSYYYAGTETINAYSLGVEII